MFELQSTSISSRHRVAFGDYILLYSTENKAKAERLNNTGTAFCTGCIFYALGFYSNTCKF